MCVRDSDTTGGCPTYILHENMEHDTVGVSIAFNYVVVWYIGVSMSYASKKVTTREQRRIKMEILHMSTCIHLYDVHT